LKIFDRIPAWLRNKYFIAIAVFASVLLFFDKNDVFTMMARNRELREWQTSKLHYINEINELDAVRDNLTNNPQTIEKYAREKYLMKRDNEELFVVVEKPANAN
jgi:cell division protein DivIC